MNGEHHKPGWRERFELARDLPINRSIYRDRASADPEAEDEAGGNCGLSLDESRETMRLVDLLLDIVYGRRGTK